MTALLTVEVFGNGLTILLVSLGAFFFLAGTAGLLRFPDLYCRLHAVAKADNLGLGLVVAGMAIQAGSWAARLQLVLTWLLVLASASVVCHLLARSSLRQGVAPVEES